MADAAQRGSKAVWKALLVTAKCALAAALVYWLWRTGKLDFSRILSVHSASAMLGVFAGQLIVLIVPLFRWALLLRARKLDFTTRQITQIGLTSYFAVLILPSIGGQEAARLYYASRIKRGRGADILATLVLDRFIGLLGLSAIAIGFGLLLVARTRSHAVMNIVALGGAIAVLLSAATAFALFRKPERLQSLIARVSVLAALLRSLEDFRSARAVLATSFALSLLAHFGSCVSMYFGFIAVDAPVGLVEACAITPLVTLTSILPLTPLGIGVADTVAETLFTLVGARSGADVTMLVRAITAVMCLACGVAYVIPLPGADAPSESHD